MLKFKNSNIINTYLEEKVMYYIEKREKVVYNNDPQRRCYNGVHYSTSSYMTEWKKFDWAFTSLGMVAWTKERAEEKLAFWVDLNAYAVRERGEGARSEYRLKKGMTKAPFV